VGVWHLRGCETEKWITFGGDSNGSGEDEVGQEDSSRGQVV
jgi:hypothetical protein